MKLIINIPEEVLKTKKYVDYFGCASAKLEDVLESGTLTVDAIPIDFIDEWIRELQGICVDDVEKNISNKFIAVALQALKFKWRKENETHK